MLTLEQAIQQLVEPAKRLEQAARDAKDGYSDVLRQVMQHQVALTELRTEVRRNEELALQRHEELLREIRKAFARG